MIFFTRSMCCLDSAASVDKLLLMILAASSGRTDNVSISGDVLTDIIKICQKNNIRLIGSGRTYNRCGRQELDVSKYNIESTIDKLTVPGTCELIKNSIGIITCHSSLNILAWKMRKPQLLLYPETEYEEFIKHKTRWAFGIDYPETFHGLFNSYEILLDKFIETL